MEENSFNIQTLQNLQQSLGNKELLVIKFTADWCGPCKKIKPLCENIIKTLPSNIKFYEINIDESIELFSFLKTKKMVSGIPAILAYKGGTKDFFYVPDDSHLGGNADGVNSFFDRCIAYVNSK